MTQSKDSSQNTDSSQQSQQHPHSSNTHKETQQETQTSKSSPGFFSTVKSVLGAMIGVQSEEQREKDFEKADPVKLILGGIIFTVVFILTILWFVNSALEGAGQ